MLHYFVTKRKKQKTYWQVPKRRMLVHEQFKARQVASEGKKWVIFYLPRLLDGLRTSLGYKHHLFF
jgi:hypothetical protein